MHTCFYICHSAFQILVGNVLSNKCSVKSFACEDNLWKNLNLIFLGTHCWKNIPNPDKMIFPRCFIAYNSPKDLIACRHFQNDIAELCFIITYYRLAFAGNAGLGKLSCAACFHLCTNIKVYAEGSDRNGSWTSCFFLIGCDHRYYDSFFLVLETSLLRMSSVHHFIAHATILWAST